MNAFGETSQFVGLFILIWIPFHWKGWSKVFVFLVIHLLWLYWLLFWLNMWSSLYSVHTPWSCNGIKACFILIVWNPWKVWHGPLDQIFKIQQPIKRSLYCRTVEPFCAFISRIVLWCIQGHSRALSAGFKIMNEVKKEEHRGLPTTQKMRWSV